MVRDLFLDLFTLPKLLINGQFLRKFTLRWHGKRPSLALRLKFLRDTTITASSNAVIRCLSFEALKYIEQNTHYFARQIIEENNEEESNLLRASWLNLYPHEVTMIRITNSQGEPFHSPIHHGGPYRGASMKELRGQITSLVFQARKKGLVIEEVEIVHTHPCVEAMIEDGRNSSFIFNGLSESDISLGKNLAPFVPYPLRIKAVTPVASYSMLF